MGRAPCCDKANVKKGPWSPEEDAKLKEFMDKYGTGGNWIALPQKAGLKRCGKSCRLRWLNYLRPNIKHGEFSDEEDKIICTLYATIGSRWSIIAAQLPGRTDNDIKNYWNTKLKKKLMGMMIPSNHPNKYSNPPFSNTFQTHSLSLSTVSHLYRDLNSFYLHQNAKNLPPFEPINPAPQNLLFSNNSDTFSLTPSHYPYFPQNQEAFVDLQFFSNGKETNNNNMLVFGGNEASCSSSDGSCSHGKDLKQEEMGGGLQGLIYGGFDGENQKFMLHNGILGSSHQLQSDVEEAKQLISSGDNNVGNGSSSTFMFTHDHDEREMYYF